MGGGLDRSKSGHLLRTWDSRKRWKHVCTIEVGTDQGVCGGKRGNEALQEFTDCFTQEEEGAEWWAPHDQGWGGWEKGSRLESTAELTERVLYLSRRQDRRGGGGKRSTLPTLKKRRIKKKAKKTENREKRHIKRKKV